MNRRFFLRCLPAAPVALTITPAAALQEGLKEPADDREAIGACEFCSKDLFQGDLVHAYADGVDLCESCAPTWLDLKDEYDRMKAEGTFVGAFEEPGDSDDAYACVLAQIEAGNGAKKHVWKL